jgi:predicted phage terminase large subunit-like protein
MVSKVQAAQRLLALQESSESFGAYCRLHHPAWKVPMFHHKLIEALDRLEKGTLLSDFNEEWAIIEHNHNNREDDKLQKKYTRPQDAHLLYNLMINMPPRHSKSTYATALFPSYYLARNPTRFSMTASYNSQLATDFGRAQRQYLQHEETNLVFPDFALSKDSRAMDVFRTTEGGAAYNIGMGATTSGRPANLLSLDDPIKSRSEADSATQRQKAWDYYTSALTTRLQPDTNGEHPIQIVCYTRWHPDDLGSRIMQTEDWAEGRWLHILFPAIMETEAAHSRPVSELPRGDSRYIPQTKINEVDEHLRTYKPIIETALWPARFPIDELKRKQRMSPRDFAALYMQNPRVVGGNLIKQQWWKLYNPDHMQPDDFSQIIVTIDTAFKKTESADYTAMMTLGLTRNGDIHVIDVTRGKWDFPELKAKAIHINNKWRGKGLRALYIEDKASGQSLIQELRRESGVSVIAHKVTHDKVTRVHAVTPLIESGRVYLPSNAPWYDNFIEETLSFPSGVNDDQVDVLSMGLDILSRTAVSPDQAFGMLTAHGSLNSSFQNTASGFATNKESRPQNSNRQRSSSSSSSWYGWGE